MFYVFFKIGVIDKYGMKDIGGNWKFVFDATRDAKKDIMGAKKLKFLYANEN
jgi:hypothetical protein